MRKIINTCLAGLLVFASTTSFAADLTRASVDALIAKVDTSANKLDAEGIAKTMSDNVEIVMNISAQGQNQVVKPSKQEYIDLLKQGWAATQNYKYTRTNMKVALNGNKAVVTADIKESMTIQGQTIAGTTKEETTIELVNNAPLITKIVGHTSM
jgi:hypothetical protein